MTYVDVVANIKKYMTVRKMNTVEMSNKSGIDLETIYNLLIDGKVVGYRELARIADTLNVDIDLLFENNEHITDEDRAEDNWENSDDYERFLQDSLRELDRLKSLLDKFYIPA